MLGRTTPPFPQALNFGNAFRYVLLQTDAQSFRLLVHSYVVQESGFPVGS